MLYIFYHNKKSNALGLLLALLQVPSCGCARCPAPLPASSLLSGPQCAPPADALSEALWPSGANNPSFLLCRRLFFSASHSPFWQPYPPGASAPPALIRNVPQAPTADPAIWESPPRSNQVTSIVL